MKYLVRQFTRPDDAEKWINHQAEEGYRVVHLASFPFIPEAVRLTESYASLCVVMEKGSHP